MDGYVRKLPETLKKKCEHRKHGHADRHKKKHKRNQHEIMTLQIRAIKHICNDDTISVVCSC